MSRYDGLIIPRSYSEYINRTDAATLQQALQLSGVLSGTVAAGDNKAVKSDAVNNAILGKLQDFKNVKIDLTTVNESGTIYIGLMDITTWYNNPSGNYTHKIYCNYNIYRNAADSMANTNCSGVINLSVIGNSLAQRQLESILFFGTNYITPCIFSKNNKYYLGFKAVRGNRLVINLYGTVIGTVLENNYALSSEVTEVFTGTVIKISDLQTS